MPMTEEERRRCILTGACAGGATPESTLAEELEDLLGVSHVSSATVARRLIERGIVVTGSGQKNSAPDNDDDGA